jgi:hypothetical protein
MLPHFVSLGHAFNLLLDVLYPPLPKGIHVCHYNCYCWSIREAMLALVWRHARCWLTPEPEFCSALAPWRMARKPLKRRSKRWERGSMPCVTPRMYVPIHAVESCLDHPLCSMLLVVCCLCGVNVKLCSVYVLVYMCLCLSERTVMLRPSVVKTNRNYIRVADCGQAAGSELTSLGESLGRR